MRVELVQVRLQLGHFSLEVDVALSGRVTAIFGASGAGKTSLLEVIAGLRRPVAGAIRVEGKMLTDVGSHRYAPPERRSVGYVPQDGALFPHLSVRKNLLYGYDATKSRPPGLNFEHVTAVLEIAPLTERRIDSLSGGEKQRVAVGRALLAAPRLLLLDEPLASLDEALRERLLPYFLRVRDEFSVPILYVTHSPDEVMALCDDVLLLSNGRVKYHGPPTGLFLPASGIRYVLPPLKPDNLVK